MIVAIQDMISVSVDFGCDIVCFLEQTDSRYCSLR